MAMLTVNRRGHIRGSHVRDVMPGRGVMMRRVPSARVKASRFKIKDRGAKGRGPKIIKIMKPGSLGVKFSDPEDVRRRQETMLAKKIGEQSVGNKLQAIAVLTKRTNPEVSAKAQADRSWVSKHFMGKKFLGVK